MDTTVKMTSFRFNSRMKATIYIYAFTVHTKMHGRPQGGVARGALAPPLEFEKMTSYTAVLQNTLKFSLAPSALSLDTRLV